MKDYAETVSPRRQQGARPVRIAKGRTVVWRTTAPCKSCSNGWLQRVHRESFSDFLLSAFGFYPFVCTTCFARRHRVKKGRLFGAACVALAATVLLGVGVRYIRGQYKLREEREMSRALEDPLTDGTAAQPAGALARGGADESGPPSTELLENRDIVRMVQSGMSTSVVRSLIARAGNRFRLDPVSLKELKKAGVPESVISSMKEAARPSPVR